MKLNSPYILFILLLSFFNALAEEPELVIDELLINSVENNIIDRIVISDKDTLELHYHVRYDSDDKPNVLFKYNFNSSNGTQSASTRFRSLKYSNLPQDKYSLLIYAFSREYTTDTLLFEIIVDNEQAKLVNELKDLRGVRNERDSLASELNVYLEEGGSRGQFDLLVVLIGVLAGALVSGLIIFSLTRNKAKALEEEFRKELDEQSKKIDKKILDKIKAENSKLRAEASTLRGQIEALHSRADDLQKQNKELQENVDKAQKSKEELEELQKQKDELFAVIIHDIKNPVALIKSLVELLRSYDLNANEQSEVIDDIFNTTKTIVSLSQEVSRILTLETSEIKLNIEKVQINDLLADAYQRYTFSAQKKKININFDPNDTVPPAEIDPDKIDEVIDNLISNAIKFSQEGSSIRLAANKLDKSLVVEVSDNGVGISEEDIKLAFKKGVKLKNRPTGNESSTGLGLWIVKKLIEAHKGRVWVKSVIGKGSTFAFSVPLRQEQMN